jgi:hypothetical protein
VLRKEGYGWKFPTVLTYERAEFLLRSYGPGSGRASEAVLQSLFYTRTNLYFYLMKLDTDYKAVYLRSVYFVKSTS